MPIPNTVRYGPNRGFGSKSPDIVGGLRETEHVKHFFV